MTISDTLFDAVNDIREYIEDDIIVPYQLENEIMDVVAVMDALRKKIDALGSNRAS